MDQKQLAYFVSVAKYRNFSRAAQDFYLTQPAISHQIKMLEKELDRLRRTISGRCLILSVCITTIITETGTCKRTAFYAAHLSSGSAYSSVLTRRSKPVSCKISLRKNQINA